MKLWLVRMCAAMLLLPLALAAAETPELRIAKPRSLDELHPKSWTLRPTE